MKEGVCQKTIYKQAKCTFQPNLVASFPEEIFWFFKGIHIKDSKTDECF